MSSENNTCIEFANDMNDALADSLEKFLEHNGEIPITGWQKLVILAPNLFLTFELEIAQEHTAGEGSADVTRVAVKVAGEAVGSTLIGEATAWFACLLIMLLLPGVAVSAEASQDLMAAHNTALSGYKETQYAGDAIKILEQAGIQNILDNKPVGISDGHYVHMLNDYGFFLSETSDRYKESIDILKRVIELSPRRVVVYLNLGDAYMKWHKETGDDKYRDKSKRFYRRYAEILKEKGGAAQLPERVARAVAEGGKETKTAEKKYPPYPDVWGYGFPVSKNVTYTAIDVIKMPDGDYMIVYIKDWEELKDRKAKDFNLSRDTIVTHGCFLFFAGKEIHFLSENEFYSFMRKMRKEGRVISGYEPPPTIFSDGSRIRGGGGPVGRCYTKLDNYFVIVDEKGKVIAEKKLLYLYDKEIQKETPWCERNFDYTGKYYFERVNVPDEMLYFPLEDDTFLFAGFLEHKDEPTVVFIRFDKNFNTKSDLINRKIFVLEEKEYHDIFFRIGDDEHRNKELAEYLKKLQKENQP